MRKVVFVVVTLLTLAGHGLTSKARADGTAVTVTGNVTAANRPAFDPFADALFNTQQIKFDKARAFSREELLKLPQHTLKVKYPNWPAEVEVKGPSLRDVLAAAGASGQTVTIRAVDGYAPEFKMSDVETDRFVLALEADHAPLAIGGRGPTWLVFPPKSYEGQPEDDGGLAWAVFDIEVR
jgi:hypothetical protein